MKKALSVFLINGEPSYIAKELGLNSKQDVFKMLKSKVPNSKKRAIQKAKEIKQDLKHERKINYTADRLTSGFIRANLKHNPKITWTAITGVLGVAASLAMSLFGRSSVNATTNDSKEIVSTTSETIETDGFIDAVIDQSDITIKSLDDIYPANENQKNNITSINNMVKGLKSYYESTKNTNVNIDDKSSVVALSSKTKEIQGKSDVYLKHLEKSSAYLNKKGFTDSQGAIDDLHTCVQNVLNTIVKVGK